MESKSIENGKATEMYAFPFLMKKLIFDRNLHSRLLAIACTLTLVLALGLVELVADV